MNFIAEYGRQVNTNVELINYSLSTINQSVKVALGGNNGKEAIMTPKDLAGFRFGRNRYKTFKYTINGLTSNFFFEVLVVAEISLFYLPVRESEYSFFITKGNDSTLIPLPKEREELHNFLEKASEKCTVLPKNINNVRGNGSNLFRYFYRLEECKSGSHPRFKIGITAGVSNYILKPGANSSILPQAKYGRQTSSHFNVFLNCPFGKTNYSFIVGTSLHQYKFADDIELSSISNYKVSYKETRLNIPAYIRYSFLQSNIVPYLECGFSFSQSISGDSFINTFNRGKLGSQIDISNGAMYGYGFGIGLTPGYNDVLNPTFGIRFTRLFSLGDGSVESISGLNDIQISAGFLF